MAETWNTYAAYIYFRTDRLRHDRRPSHGGPVRHLNVCFSELERVIEAFEGQAHLTDDLNREPASFNEALAVNLSRLASNCAYHASTVKDYAAVVADLVERVASLERGTTGLSARIRELEAQVDRSLSRGVALEQRLSGSEYHGGRHPGGRTYEHCDDWRPEGSDLEGRLRDRLRGERRSRY